MHVWVERFFLRHRTDLAAWSARFGQPEFLHPRWRFALAANRLPDEDISGMLHKRQFPALITDRHHRTFLRRNPNDSVVPDPMAAATFSK